MHAQLQEAVAADSLLDDPVVIGIPPCADGSWIKVARVRAEAWV